MMTANEITNLVISYLDGNVAETKQKLQSMSSIEVISFMAELAQSEGMPQMNRDWKSAYETTRKLLVNKTYTVSVPEVYIRTYIVEAVDEDEATNIVETGGGSQKGDIEYQRTLGFGAWAVKEKEPQVGVGQITDAQNDNPTPCVQDCKDCGSPISPQ
jgi:hypothetical protein